MLVSRPFSTNDTVVRETPARAATSALVGRLESIGQISTPEWRTLGPDPAASEDAGQSG
jgi:hypothetical protein